MPTDVSGMEASRVSDRNPNAVASDGVCLIVIPRVARRFPEDQLCLFHRGILRLCLSQIFAFANRLSLRDFASRVVDGPSQGLRRSREIIFADAYLSPP